LTKIKYNQSYKSYEPPVRNYWWFFLDRILKLDYHVYVMNKQDIIEYLKLRREEEYLSPHKVNQKNPPMSSKWEHRNLKHSVLVS